MMTSAILEAVFGPHFALLQHPDGRPVVVPK
jgi:hypothetical protein